MFCSRCGRRIAENSKFCIYCGESVSSLKPADPFADFDAKDTQIGRTDAPDVTPNETETQPVEPPVQPEQPVPPVQPQPPQNDNSAQKRYIVTPPPYQYNYTPPQPPVNVPVDDTKLNGFSISGFVLGIIGLLLCLNGVIHIYAGNLISGLFAVAGLILSIVGIMKSKEYKSGKILGIVGGVLGIISIILWVVMAVMVILVTNLY